MNEAEKRSALSEAKSLIPSAALVGVGLLLESELLVGVALGTGIMIVARWLPESVGDTVRPVVNGTVGACYSAAAKTSEIVGHAARRAEGIITRQFTTEQTETKPEGDQAPPQQDQHL